MSITDSIHLFVKRSQGKTQQARPPRKSCARRARSAEQESQKPGDPEFARVMEHVRTRFEKVV